jgi:hypothetical protein
LNPIKRKWQLFKAKLISFTPYFWLFLHKYAYIETVFLESSIFNVTTKVSVSIEAVVH